MKIMDRETVLEAFLQEHVLERWVDDVPRIEENYFASQTEIETSLLEAVTAVCEQAVALQQEGRKGRIRYLYISWLRTRLMGGEGMYRIDAYDGHWLLDRVECSTLWSADFVFEPLFRRMERWEQTIKGYARRMTIMDLEQIGQIEAVKYHHLAVSFLHSMVPLFIHSEALQKLDKEPGFTIFAGEYRDESEPLCRWVLEDELDQEEAEARGKQAQSEQARSERAQSEQAQSERSQAERAKTADRKPRHRPSENEAVNPAAMNPSAADQPSRNNSAVDPFELGQMELEDAVGKEERGTWIISS
ncbi:hypothetical protein [Paenibacillus massiliensis]|uniref:hypothetical protein n=1 Tax=Paenibacillus massiliensis TaxID=225917 RepID=UPI0004715C73|nr:hypothetical protein [Paenibacillus massiliensis]